MASISNFATQIFFQTANLEELHPVCSSLSFSVTMVWAWIFAPETDKLQRKLIQMGYLHQSDLVSDFKSQKSHLFTMQLFPLSKLATVANEHWRLGAAQTPLQSELKWSLSQMHAAPQCSLTMPLCHWFSTFFQHPPWRQEWQLLSYCQLKIWFYDISWYIWRILKRSEGHFSTWSYIQGVKGFRGNGW